MDLDLADLNAFLTVASAKGFRDGARASGGSASASAAGAWNRGAARRSSESSLSERHS
jgi:hypothetical protein